MTVEPERAGPALASGGGSSSDDGDDETPRAITVTRMAYPDYMRAPADRSQTTTATTASAATVLMGQVDRRGTGNGVVGAVPEGVGR